MELREERKEFLEAAKDRLGPLPTEKRNKRLVGSKKKGNMIVTRSLSLV